MKNGGRCIAGKIVNSSGEIEGWIRPISKRITEELNVQERLYRDKTDPKLLDLIEVEVEIAKPHLHQQENWIISDQTRMIKKGVIPKNAIRNLLDKTETLWSTGSSSNLGVNDRVSPTELSVFKTSLYFIEVEELLIFKNYYYDKVDLRGQFIFENSVYKFKITDPDFRSSISTLAFGKYFIESAFLTVSLAESEYKGFFYKLIAGIIPMSGVIAANE